MFALVTFLTGAADSYSQARLDEIEFAIGQNQLNPHIQTVTLVHDWPSNHNLIKHLAESGVGLEQFQPSDPSDSSEPSFTDLIRICNRVPGRRTVIAYPDTFFPVNSGLGTLVSTDLTRHRIALTPYVYCVGKVRDQYISGVTRPYRDRKIKLHGLDGRAVASWVFETPVKVDHKRINSSLVKQSEPPVKALDQFASPAGWQLTDAFARHGKISNPSLEIVSIRMHNSWHPRVDYGAADLLLEAPKKIAGGAKGGCAQSEIAALRASASACPLPCTLAEIGRTIQDASGGIDKMPVELQRFIFNGSRMVKMTPNPFTRGVPFKQPDPLSGLRQKVAQDRTRNNGVSMTRRLWHPEQVTGAFVIAQQRGQALLKRKKTI